MTEVRIYKARPGAQIRDKDAQVIGEFVEKKFNGNVIHPQSLVAAARPERSRIHRFFDWEDTVAAENWRTWQARNLLKSISYMVISDDEEVETRAFHNVVVVSEEGADRGYVMADVVWQHPDLSAQVVEKAKRELESWAQRYKSYSDLSQQVAVIMEEVIPIFEAEAA